MTSPRSEPSPRAGVWVRPACVLCDKPCVPLADYDVPVCVGCDDNTAAVIAASIYERKLHSTPMPRRRRTPSGPVKPCGTHAAFNRHKANGQRPCIECVIGESNYQAARRRKPRVAA